MNGDVSKLRGSLDYLFFFNEVDGIVFPIIEYYNRNTTRMPELSMSQDFCFCGYACWMRHLF